MSNLDKAARDKLPSADFGDPTAKLFPIVDASDVADAASLIGKAKNPEAVKARIIAIAKRKGFTSSIPKAWSDTAAMSAVFTADGETIVRRGKLWEAGSYPDKHFSMTPEEMLAAVADFAPVPVDLEHTPTVLSGRLGQVKSIEIGDNPFDLYGDVELPKWLDDALGDTERKVSATWDRETKRMAGLALVLDPAIEDAALFAMAAFAKAQHRTPQGQQTLQMVHDDVARAGAICNPPADFASKPEAAAVQTIHQITVDNGATCASGSKPAWYARTPTPAAETATGSAVRFSTGKEKTMSFAEHFRTWFTGGMVGELPLADDPPTPAATPAATFNASTPDPEKEAMKAQIASLQAARIETASYGAADAEIAAHRAFPYERDALIASFSRALRDDEASPANFAAGEKSRVQLWHEDHNGRPAHNLTTEQLKPEDVTAIFNQMDTAQAGAPKPMTPERRAALLGMTGIGQDVLAHRNGSQN